MFNCYGCPMCEAGSKKLSVKNNPLYLFRNLRTTIQSLNLEYKLLRWVKYQTCVLSFSGLLIYHSLATDCMMEEEN